MPDAKEVVLKALFPSESALDENWRKTGRVGTEKGRKRATCWGRRLETILNMVPEVHWRIQNKKQPHQCCIWKYLLSIDAQTLDVQTQWVSLCSGQGACWIGRKYFLGKKLNAVSSQLDWTLCLSSSLKVEQGEKQYWLEGFPVWTQGFLLIF